MKTFKKRLWSTMFWAVFSVCLAVAQTSTIKHTVDRGETLTSIAQRYGTTEAKIIELNPDAKQFIYVGMELIIPNNSREQYTEKNSSSSKTTNAQQTKEVLLRQRALDSHDTYKDVTKVSEFDSERKTCVYELTYSAYSFEDVKLSGTYGFSLTILPWELGPKLYAGVHFSPLNFNFGLSDFNYDEIRVGPAIGYYFTPKIFISMPLDLLCDVNFDERDKTKTDWGMALAPTMYIGSKAGFFIGPQFTIRFSSDSEVSCGFRAGIYF